MSTIKYPAKGIRFYIRGNNKVADQYQLSFRYNKLDDMSTKEVWLTGKDFYRRYMSGRNGYWEVYIFGNWHSSIVIDVTKATAEPQGYIKITLGA